jgi:hypothetical protein
MALDNFIAGRRFSRSEIQNNGQLARALVCSIPVDFFGDGLDKRFFHSDGYYPPIWFFLELNVPFRKRSEFNNGIYLQIARLRMDRK